MSCVFHNVPSLLDLGQHITRVDLPAYSRRASCTGRYVYVPVKREHGPPMIQVYTWGGELVRTLGAGDLGLRDNEWCWGISPVYDGKLNVLVTDTDDQEYIVTYKVTSKRERKRK